MKYFGIEEVIDLIKKSEFVNSIDEVWVDDDLCSVMIMKDCSIDEEGLADYLTNNFYEVYEVFEVVESEFYGDRVEQWKEANGIEEDDDVYIYKVQLQLDNDVLNGIIQSEYDVKICDDDGCFYMTILEGEISEDEILDTLDEYGFSRDRISVRTNSLMFFEGTEVQFEVYS